MTTPIRGVWTALMTPLESDGRIAFDLLTAHCRWLFANGVDGVTLFGTSGEGQSFSLDERREALERLLASGIQADRVTVGTATSALPETAALTRHAAALGVAGALVLPPFFFKGLSDDGVYDSFAALCESLKGVKTRLILYHIPQVSAVKVAPKVVARLAKAYPDLISGVKDSAGEWENTAEMLKLTPQLGIMVGHEPFIPRLLKAGGVGTICGVANVRPDLIRRLYDSAGKPDEAALTETVSKVCALVTDVPFVPAIKVLIAEQARDKRWLNVRAPLVRCNEAEQKRLVAAMTAFDAEALAAD
ncbi:MAG: dihydrodipicolinate synthase family protein [Alphaproteobacteria bacterium]|nr:dihydrodipicolinate synthase family protein [Alphaproteobacteria bacterium]